MKNYFECHVTMVGDKAMIKTMTEELRWKFSAIDGDPVLGAGVKCYATMLYSAAVHTQESCVEKTINIADRLSGFGVKILRRKVELVVFDDRDVSDVCDGGYCAVNG